jgi:hypothetical protein
MTLVHRLVSGHAALDRVPAEVRPLVERCLAADPLARPTARILLAETGEVQPAGSWLPAGVTRSFATYPAQAEAPAHAEPGYVPTTISPVPAAITNAPTQAFAPATMATPRLTSPSLPRPHAGARQRGRLGGRLAIALVAAGLVGALGAGGASLTAFAHGSSGEHHRKLSPTHLIHQPMLAPRPTQTATMDPPMLPPMAPTATPTASMTPTPIPTPTMTTVAPTPTPTPTMTTVAPTPTPTLTTVAPTPTPTLTTVAPTPTPTVTVTTTPAAS